MHGSFVIHLIAFVSVSFAHLTLRTSGIHACTVLLFLCLRLLVCQLLNITSDSQNKVYMYVWPCSSVFSVFTMTPRDDVRSR